VDADGVTTAALVLPVPSARALDAAVAEVRRFTTDAVGSIWDLGQALIAIHDQKLYLARHTSWDAFVVEEVGLLPRATHRYMAMSRAFTREAVTMIGPTKLDLVLRVPEGQRPALLEQARTSSGPELARAVKQLGIAPRKKGAYLRRDARGVSLPLGSTTLLLASSKSGQPARAIEDVPVGEIRPCPGEVVRFMLVADGNRRMTLLIEVKRKRRRDE